MIRALLAAAYLLLLASLWWLPADARMHHPARGHRIVAGGGAPPLDSFTQPSGAYSFRKLRSAYAGSAIRIRRASDNLELDINFLGFVPGLGAPWDVAAATAHCAATTCFIRTWYDQSGNAADLVQTVAASQLNLVFNCNGTLPCARALGVVGQSVFTLAAITPVLPVSISAVSSLTTLGASSPTCIWMAPNGNANDRLSTFAAGWFLGGGGSFAAVPQPSVGAWHAQQGVINGAASVLNIDGAETTGSLPGSTTAAVSFVGYAGTLGSVCSFAEGIHWSSGYALFPAERAFLRSNQSGYWVTP